MEIDSAGLRRFELGGMLGEGADLQVFSGRDLDTDLPVVVKRPHPALIARSRHRDLERRVERVVSLRESVGESLPQVPRLIAHTTIGAGDSYFDDSLGEEYTVTVEERARGLPLIGSPVDGIKGMPIGLPHNLFGLHPLVRHPATGSFTILTELLDLVEAFHHAGALLLDLRPENVFFEPGGAAVTVVDVGGLGVERAVTRRRTPLDLHDCYLELLKWYTTPSGPPDNSAAYAKPAGPRSESMFSRDLADMQRGFRGLAPGSLGTAALGILDTIEQRGYGTLGDFRQDFEVYLGLVDERYAQLREDRSLVTAWRDALSGLYDPYWGKFLFEPEEDLAP